MFCNSIQFWWIGRSKLMYNSPWFKEPFPVLGDIFPTIIRSKSLRSLVLLKFHFCNKIFDDFSSLWFLIHKSNPCNPRSSTDQSNIVMRITIHLNLKRSTQTGMNKFEVIPILPTRNLSRSLNHFAFNTRGADEVLWFSWDIGIGI